MAHKKEQTCTAKGAAQHTIWSPERIKCLELSAPDDLFKLIKRGLSLKVTRGTAISDNQVKAVLVLNDPCSDQQADGAVNDIWDLIMDAPSWSENTKEEKAIPIPEDIEIVATLRSNPEKIVARMKRTATPLPCAVTN